jgi:DNA-binding CsgD family transcriptional regulator
VRRESTGGEYRMRANGVTRLSAGQKECLRLVLHGYEAKEIARTLGTSPGAVHERLRAARRTLDVSSSREAARILARHEQGETYTPFVAQPIGIEAGQDSPMLATTITGGSAGGEAGGAFLRECQADFHSAHVEGQRFFPWPFPSTGRPHNDLTTLQTIIAVVALTIGLGIAALVAVALVDQLTQLKLG